jgi:hypothetical protein
MFVALSLILIGILGIVYVRRRGTRKRASGVAAR